MMKKKRKDIACHVKAIILAVVLMLSMGIGGTMPLTVHAEQDDDVEVVWQEEAFEDGEEGPKSDDGEGKTETEISSGNAGGVDGVINPCGEAGGDAKSEK